MVLNHSRVKNIPVYKCEINLIGCGHISYSCPGESRIMPVSVIVPVLCDCILHVSVLVHTLFRTSKHGMGEW